ncbi:hypothetical protein ACSBR2_035492 [Camellia fascicularis]
MNRSNLHRLRHTRSNLPHHIRSKPYTVTLPLSLPSASDATATATVTTAPPPSPPLPPSVSVSLSLSLAQKPIRFEAQKPSLSIDRSDLYCEERPLLVGNVGMGARLCTYYQKSTPGDQTGNLLRNGNTVWGVSSYLILLINLLSLEI